jgi:hypothetical protein
MRPPLINGKGPVAAAIVEYCVTVEGNVRVSGRQPLRNGFPGLAGPGHAPGARSRQNEPGSAS